jgi:hypothetical protein
MGPMGAVGNRVAISGVMVFATRAPGHPGLGPG